MAINFAINGFGRIGKAILRALTESPEHIGLRCKAINIGSNNLETHLHLLKYDSTHGIFNKAKAIDEHTIDIGFGPIAILKERDPNKLNWQKHNIDLVMECTGALTKKENAIQHINNGAKKVLVSAPCEGADATIVYGVNDQTLNDKHLVVSIGSCTTNCLAPLAKVLNESVGLESGFMTTIHAYTNDQNILDATHKDKRRARAAALSMIPTSTGAAKSLGIVIPELAGKLDGVAIRVPVPNVSLVDLTFLAKKPTTPEEINKAFFKAKEGKMAKILDVITEELVSVDFNHNEFSCVFDTTQTKVVNGTMCRVAAWYDNEWGFANRMLDMANLIANL
jgi:glyceraldehyde 3-phosphate dehydrogenase